MAEKLAALEQAARGSDNLMPPILDAAGCTPRVSAEVVECICARLFSAGTPRSVRSFTPLLALCEH